jgi:hypothetical protein
MLTEGRIQGIKKIISQANLGMPMSLAMDTDVQSAIKFLQDMIGRYYDPAAVRQREKVRRATVQWRVEKSRERSKK